MSEIGLTLRKTRESKNLSLEDAEKVTCIKARYLQALEEGRWDDLPGPVQVRGFLKKYAAFLGLDGNALVNLKERESAKSPAVASPGLFGVPANGLKNGAASTRPTPTRLSPEPLRPAEVRTSVQPGVDQPPAWPGSASDIPPNAPNAFGGGDLPPASPGLDSASPARQNESYSESLYFDPPDATSALTQLPETQLLPFPGPPGVTPQAAVPPPMPPPPAPSSVPKSAEMQPVVATPTVAPPLSSPATPFPGAQANTTRQPGTSRPDVTLPPVLLAILQRLSMPGWLSLDMLMGGIALALSVVVAVLAARSYLLPLVSSLMTPPQPSRVALAQTKTAITPTPTLTPTAVFPANPNGKIEIGLVAVTEHAWVRVSTDGVTAFEGMLAPSQSLSWEANDNVIVETGNGGALNFTVNGNTMGPLGEQNQITIRAWSSRGEVLPPATPSPSPPTETPPPVSPPAELPTSTP